MSPGATGRCAVLGQPVDHSLSPLIHRRAYEVLGIADGWSYGRHQVGEGGLAAFVAGLDVDWVGLSCTAPLKAETLLLGEASETARILNSGNTVLLGRGDRPHRIENTDVTGFVGALSRSGVTSARTAVIGGNGATARSALYALAQLGVDEVVVSARSAERAHASLDGLAAHLGISWQVAGWGEVPPGRFDVLVWTVSAPVPAAVAADLVGRTEVCFEATYNHYPTVFDRAAQTAGITQLSGLDLLVSQARDQIRLMTGYDCPAEPLLEVVHAAVG
ncbi:MAG: shikimate dehydrogenase family protein [Propioniciclava sp.]